MPLTGSEILAKALVRQGVELFFFLMGGPMLLAEKACLDAGIRGIDVRHEQAAGMMAHAYSRVLNRPAVCMGASGPGAINFVTSLANALVDCTPVIAIGGSSSVAEYGKGAFQEIDQVAVMRPVVKWAERVYDPRRIPEYVGRAFREALAGKPGPVYLDLPGDVLYRAVEEGEIDWSLGGPPPERPRPVAPPARVEEIVRLLAEAERPVVVTGSGILWSEAAGELQAFVDATGVPFYTTPQGRGVVPEDHPHCFLNARSTAFKEADAILVVGTRLNYVLGYGEAPRMNAAARLVRIDIDPGEIAASPRPSLGIVGDAKAVLAQLVAALRGRVDPSRYEAWRAHLAGIDRRRAEAQEALLNSDQLPIHPLRLCKEVRDFLDRDAILVVDGQEILNFGRQSIPTYHPGHRLNSGPFGIMGVGLPFGIGAKLARPDKQVVVLHGDGSFAMNGIELDTAVRHRIPLLTVVSLNGGWTADPDQWKPGRNLGYTRFHDLARSLDCHGEFVEEAHEIRPALDRAARAVAEGTPALVNVVTDWRARAQTAKFSPYAT